MHDHREAGHSHGNGLRLTAEQQRILAAGLEQLLAASSGCVMRVLMKPNATQFTLTR